MVSDRGCCARGLAASFATCGARSPAGAEIEAAFEWPLSCAEQIHSQQQRQRGYSLSVPRARGRVHREGQGQRRLMTSASRPRSSPQTPAHRAASSCCTPRLYRAIHTTGHAGRRHRKHPEAHQLPDRAHLRRRGISRPQNAKPAAHLHLRPEAQRRRNHRARAAPPLSHRAVIGHMKAEGHLGRCYLKGRHSRRRQRRSHRRPLDLRLVLAWLRFCRASPARLCRALATPRSHTAC